MIRKHDSCIIGIILGYTIKPRIIYRKYDIFACIFFAYVMLIGVYALVLLFISSSILSILVYFQAHHPADSSLVPHLSHQKPQFFFILPFLKNFFLSVLIHLLYSHSPFSDPSSSTSPFHTNLFLQSYPTSIISPLQ